MSKLGSLYIKLGQLAGAPYALNAGLCINITE